MDFIKNVTSQLRLLTNRRDFLRSCIALTGLAACRSIEINPADAKSLPLDNVEILGRPGPQDVSALKEILQTPINKRIPAKGILDPSLIVPPVIIYSFFMDVENIRNLRLKGISSAGLLHQSGILDTAYHSLSTDNLLKKHSHKKVILLMYDPVTGRVAPVQPLVVSKEADLMICKAQIKEPFPIQSVHLDNQFLPSQPVYAPFYTKRVILLENFKRIFNHCQFHYAIEKQELKVKQKHLCKLDVFKDLGLGVEFEKGFEYAAKSKNTRFKQPMRCEEVKIRPINSGTPVLGRYNQRVGTIVAALEKKHGKIEKFHDFAFYTIASVHRFLIETYIEKMELS